MSYFRPGIVEWFMNWIHSGVMWGDRVGMVNWNPVRLQRKLHKVPMLYLK